MPNPPFKIFSLDTLNTEQKPSVKKIGRPGRSETGQPAMILKFTGRVEKILTGSISGSVVQFSWFLVQSRYFFSGKRQ